MKKISLLLLVMTIFFTGIFAQKNQKNQKNPTGYAITAFDKGERSWKEVRLVDISTGEELQSIYNSKNEVEALNARTGKAITKKELSFNNTATRKVVNLDRELDQIATARVKMISASPPTDQSGKPSAVRIQSTGESDKPHTVRVESTDQPSKPHTVRVESTDQSGKRTTYVIESPDQLAKPFIVHAVGGTVRTDQPFATNSAALAYDKKHERLYYTPMGINQLRYIDLQSKTPKVYYFEDDPFGALTGPGDVSNQITRMVIASDGNGYALTNNCEHLFSFTTGKNPVITDLGALTDDPANTGKKSIRSRNGSGDYGGDIIADASMNLYLITAQRNVFKVSIESKVATYLGSISGLPKGFTTNGAMVEGGSKVIVASSESTVGYYRFDLNTLQAEKASESGNVFNASDLANGNLAFEKEKKKKDRHPVETKETPKQEITDVTKPNPVLDPVEPNEGNIMVYPNPVTDGLVKLSFTDQPAGKYKVQVIDMSGKLISSREVMINSKLQIEELKLGEALSKGNYMIKVSNENANISFTQKVLVQ